MLDICGSQGSEYKNTVICNMTSDSLLRTHRYVAERCCFPIQCVWVNHTPATWAADVSQIATNLYHIDGVTFIPEYSNLVFKKSQKENGESVQFVFFALLCYEYLNQEKIMCFSCVCVCVCLCVSARALERKNV